MTVNRGLTFMAKVTDFMKSLFFMQVLNVPMPTE